MRGGARGTTIAMIVVFFLGVIGLLAQGDICADAHNPIQCENR